MKREKKSYWKHKDLHYYLRILIYFFPFYHVAFSSDMESLDVAIHGSMPFGMAPPCWLPISIAIGITVLGGEV
jgi:hypothetical protein